MEGESVQEHDADFSTTLSSELLVEIVQRYFNEEMYKKPVKVVDQEPVKGDSGGYIFMLAFVRDVEMHPIEMEVEKIGEQATPVSYSMARNGQRDDKGKFTSKGKVKQHG